MKFVPAFFGFGLMMAAASGAVAKPAYVPATLNLRAAPGLKSEIVTKIPGGSLIDAGECTEGWCEVTFNDKKGFAKQTAIDLSGRVTPRSAANTSRRGPSGSHNYVEGSPVYADGPVEYVEPPTVYYADPPRYYYDRSYVPYYRRYSGWHHGWW